MTPEEESSAVLIAFGDQVLAELRAETRKLRDLNALLAEFDPGAELEEFDW